MFGFIKKMFITAIGFIGLSGYSSISLKFVLMNNQELRVRPAMLNINSNEFLLFPYDVLANKCSDNCNNINNLYAKLCVPDVVET